MLIITGEKDHIAPHAIASASYKSKSAIVPPQTSTRSRRPLPGLRQRLAGRGRNSPGLHQEEPLSQAGPNFRQGSRQATLPAPGGIGPQPHGRRLPARSPVPHRHGLISQPDRPNETPACARSSAAHHTGTATGDPEREPEQMFWALADKTWPSIVISKLVRAAVRAPGQRGCLGAVATCRPGIRTIGPIPTGIAHGCIWPASPPRSTTDGCSQQTVGRLQHTGSGSGCAVGGFSVPAEHLFWFRGSCLQAPPSLIAERGNLRISR